MNYEQYASLVMPETAILELTEYCNFNCVHCYETHQRESLLDIDDYITVLHDLKRLGCFKIRLIGRMSGWKKLNKPLARQGKRL